MTTNAGAADSVLYRAARIADMRQRLATPSRAISEYCEFIVASAATLAYPELNDDLQRIEEAAVQLNTLVDHLLTGNLPQEYAREDDAEVERRLRHDLRTPINGILGYGEIVSEDIEDYGAESIKADLDNLLGETRQLLDQLDSIVNFTRQSDDVEAVATAGTSDKDSDTDRAMADLLGRISGDTTNETEDIVGSILVVDDIKTNRDLLNRRLSQDGHTVHTAVDGRDALKKLRENPVDLVLLDLMMPDLNGFEVLERMKADPELRSIPVIIISALEETDGAIKCIEKGAHDYLPKPFNPVMLRARIRSGLEGKKWTDAEREQRRFIQDAFSRFISTAVVDQLVSDPGKLKMGGERTQISCVFTDLADFTSLIETTEPTLVLPLLNEYLDGLCRIVLKFNGTIDKIVGDALHAFFGAPLKQPDHAQLSVNCAVALDEYARDFMRRPDAVALNFGATRIGVHTGVGVVGNFGGEAFFDYTAHGDVVNTAARMEGANKHLGTTVCVSKDTVDLCDGIDFRPVGDLLLKGKTRSVSAWQPHRTGEKFCPLLQYKHAYQLMSDSYEDAASQFALLHDLYPEDTLVEFHFNRLRNNIGGASVKLTDK